MVKDPKASSDNQYNGVPNDTFKRTMPQRKYYGMPSQQAVLLDHWSIGKAFQWPIPRTIKCNLDSEEEAQAHSLMFRKILRIIYDLDIIEKRNKYENILYGTTKRHKQTNAEM